MLSMSRTSVILIQMLNTHVSSNMQVWKGYRLGLWGPNTGGLLLPAGIFFYLGNSEPIFHILLLSRSSSEVWEFKNIYRLSDFKDHVQRPCLQHALLKPNTASFEAVLPGARNPRLAPLLLKTHFVRLQYSRDPHTHTRTSTSDAENRLAAILNISRSFHTLGWDLKLVNTSKMTLHLYI